MTDQTVRRDAPSDRGEPSPFGVSRGPRRRLVGALVFGALLVGTGVGVFLLTRKAGPAEGATRPVPGEAPAKDARTPVMLSAEDARRIGVTYAPAIVTPLDADVRLTGMVTYDETRVKTVAPKMDGWIERLVVNITGERVAQGDVLFTIYSPMLVTAQEELLLARRLQRDVAAGSADAVRSADDLVASARRRLLYWDVPEDEIADIERTGAVRKAVAIRSPVSGVVTEKNVSAGQKIMAGEAIYRIVDLRVVWLEGEVFERDLPGVAVGAAVTADVAALPGQPQRGRVAYVYPTLSGETRTARIRVELQNGSGALKPGMYATMHLRRRDGEAALSVPRSALLATGRQTLVFLKDRGGSLVPREVRVGRTTDDRVEILAGLQQGDTVVASATFLIDAESNLGSALGGMSNMSGMEAPKAKTPVAAPKRPPAVPR